MLEIDSVSIRFGSAPEAVSNTSFQVCDGDHMVVIGETGSGKSVLLQAALGLLPANARVSGRILLDGKDLLACGEREMNSIRGKKIAYIPQGSGNGLNPLYTIGHQMCETIRKHKKCTRTEALAQAAALLESFGLENGAAICRQYPFQLSGGMRQRVLIAMGIAAGAELVLDGEPLTFRGPQRWKVQILFQHPEVAFDPRMTLESSMREPYRFLKKQYAHQALCEFLERFGIYEEHLARYPAELSGGELQRLALARAMLMGPAFLILDEPTSMLDVVSQAQVIQLLQQLQRERNVGYLFISHDEALCRRFCTSICRLQNGHLSEKETVQA